MEPQVLQGWTTIALAFVLVCVTAWYASQTRRLVRTAESTATHAAAAAAAAQRSALAAELGLRIQNLPVVIPEVVENIQLGQQLVLKNAGSTAAVNIDIGVFAGTGDDSPVWAESGPQILEPNARVWSIPFPFEKSSVLLAADAKATIEVRYEDPSGHRYRFRYPYRGSSPAQLLRWEDEAWVPFLPED